MISFAELIEAAMTFPIAGIMLMAALPQRRYTSENRREPSLDLSKFQLTPTDYLGRTEPGLGGSA